MDELTDPLNSIDHIERSRSTSMENFPETPPRKVKTSHRHVVKESAAKR